MATPIRLYLVDRLTGKKTGKKRDYASIDNFNKYGIETYERYNRELNIFNEPTGTKAEMCYYEDGKWVKVSDGVLPDLLAGNLTDD